ncbi:bactofilin family protein [Minwuia sp.]|uniref:bactofilin family protein n=1 Tax=Minwuia sp. TaxID=2493630 RepID=UPI003A8D37D5
MFSKSRTPATRPAAKVPATPSLISHGLAITGDLYSDGEIQIDGSVTGDIDCQRLVIGEQAVVKGEVVAETVVVRGTIEGRVRGSDVSLSKSARVIGDIMHRSLSMEAGAHLEGQVKRVDDPRALESTAMPKLLQTGKPTRLEAHDGGADRKPDVAAGL